MNSISTHTDDWNRHWEQYSDTAGQNPAQKYRRELIFSLLGIEGSGKGVRLLDIGSGQGDMLAAIRARFPDAELLGLDLSRSGVEIAQQKVPGGRFVVRNLLADEPAGKLRGWATHGICSEVIEHVDTPSTLLRNAREYMTQNCKLVLTAPGGPMSAFDKHIGHRKHWKPGEIDVLLREAGYTPEQVGGVGFPFFNLYRCMVILRGKKLITDVGAGSPSSSTWAARAAMRAFQLLIRPPLNSSRWGWQMVAKARLNAC